MNPITRYRYVVPSINGAFGNDAGDLARILLSHLIATLPEAFDYQMAQLLAYKSDAAIRDMLEYARRTLPPTAYAICNERDGSLPDVKTQAKILARLLKSDERKKLTQSGFKDWLIAKFGSAASEVAKLVAKEWQEEKDEARSMAEWVSKLPVFEATVDLIAKFMLQDPAGSPGLPAPQDTVPRPMLPPGEGY